MVIAVSRADLILPKTVATVRPPWNSQPLFSFALFPGGFSIAPLHCSSPDTNPPILSKMAKTYLFLSTMSHF